MVLLVFCGAGTVIGEANTGRLPDTTLSGVSCAHSIATVTSLIPVIMSVPGKPGIPVSCGGTAAAPKDASKINEFPVVFPTAVEIDRGTPLPPGSSGFLQIYSDTPPVVGESPQ